MAELAPKTDVWTLGERGLILYAREGQVGLTLVSGVGQSMLPETARELLDTLPHAIKAAERQQHARRLAAVAAKLPGVGAGT